MSQATVFGRRDGVWREYEYPGGVAKAAAVWTGDGSRTVLVTCIYGPSDWIDSGQAQALLLSLTER